MTYRKPKESARKLAVRIYACDSHSETECTEAIATAIEGVETDVRDLRTLLGKAITNLQRTTACIGMIEDDGHWKARDAANAFLSSIGQETA